MLTAKVNMFPIASFHIEDAGYPVRLRALAHPPKQIFTRGCWNDKVPTVSIVGARAASKQSQDRAYLLAKELAEAGVTIVSGGAFGVDAAAHNGAMAAHGKTCAVLGTAVTVAYPRRHEHLFADILVQGGCLLSCFPTEAKVTKWNFPLRNDLIAALSDATILIQSPPTSGSRYTAQTAMKLNKQVLLFQDAMETRDLWGKQTSFIKHSSDVLATLQGQKLPPSPTTNHDSYSEINEKLLHSLSNSPKGLYEISLASGLELSTCVAGLLELEMYGHCTRMPGERYIATVYEKG